MFDCVFLMMSLLKIIRFLFLYVYYILAGCPITTVQSINEFGQSSSYFYAADDHNVMRRVYHTEPIDRNVVEIAHKGNNNVYCLYTRENPLKEEILLYNDENSIATSKFNSSKVTVFIIHGWVGNRSSMINTVLTKAFLQDNDVNVVVVDWGELARSSYFTLVLSISAVGRHIGKFIIWLTTLGVSYEKVHIVGHSLGAHAAGNAGKETKGRIKRITGLDPAGPLWESVPYRLVKSDAQYVEIIHTNTKCLGYNGLCGDADFFPNGGQNMPNCYISTCSHSRAFYYMAYTITNNGIYAKECSNMSEVDSNSCEGELYPMGNSDLTKNRSGIFRVDIESKNLKFFVPANLLSRQFIHSKVILKCELKLF